jgi:hypothetical protein
MRTNLACAKRTIIDANRRNVTPLLVIIVAARDRPAREQRNMNNARLVTHFVGDLIGWFVNCSVTN